ncbi:MAG TPA: DUF4157 domain-containing protein, partial [Methanotrichaceae archaeon]|nr:DUF4157 domain-containing protein [Methanotrichaceae archaeon]
QRLLAHELTHVVQQKRGVVHRSPLLPRPLSQLITTEIPSASVGDHPNQKNVEMIRNSGVAPMLPNKLIIQRMVPPQGGGNFKEIPETVYVARGGENIPFNKEKHQRKMFSFGAHTRNEVFMKYNPQFAGNRIISIRSSTGEQVNVEGVQLDHQISWDTISTFMDTVNKGNGTNWNNQVGYSLWDAKMYYNDIDNLVPALGAINASAGELGVNEIPRIHSGLEIYQGNIQTAWMNLQAGLVALGYGISDESAEGIADLLAKIVNVMNDVTEELL